MEDFTFLQHYLGQTRNLKVKWYIFGGWPKQTQMVQRWKNHVSPQQQRQSQTVMRGGGQLEVLIKWGRGESFPALLFSNRRLTKTLDTRSHLRGCSHDNWQGQCGRANTHTYRTGILIEAFIYCACSLTPGHKHAIKFLFMAKQHSKILLPLKWTAVVPFVLVDNENPFENANLWRLF